MKIIDTHCHLYPSEMQNAEEIIMECKNNNISVILNGVDIASNNEILELSKKYDNVYAAIGLNYDQIDTFTDDDLVLLEEQIKNNKIVALGEIGIDYYWTKENSEKQIYFFKKQLELAEKYDLPVIVHAREASQEVFDIIKNSNVRKGSMHCYAGSIELAKEYIKLGFYIGIDGPITYDNNRKGVELVSNIPVENLLIETDSPYLSPLRGQINTPLNLKYIAGKISEIKNISIEEIYEITYNNANNLFVLED
ncbi:MAG: TatD family hydrolase [Bacilli bacterium]|nr:TatD family hydrolase [Bacilli bacterium]